MIPANLIVNADDFGLDPRVSLAISQCLDEGLINSFSVFPFADPFHDRLLREVLVRHPGARVGVHLSLVTPAAGLGREPAESDDGGGTEAGGFREGRNHFREFLGLYLTGRYPPARVRREWKAQIESVGRYLGGPGRLAHLDSHQHLHVIPGLWRAAKSLQTEFAIPRLRVPYESLRRSVFYRFPFGFALQILARMRRGGSAPRFLGFLTSTRFTLEANRAGLEEVIHSPGSVFELMVHPALAKAPPPPGWPETGESLVVESQEREMAELRLLACFFGSRRNPGKV